MSAINGWHRIDQSNLKTHAHARMKSRHRYSIDCIVIELLRLRKNSLMWRGELKLNCAHCLWRVLTLLFYLAIAIEPFAIQIRSDNVTWILK